MLTWNVTYHCKPGKREEFFKAISALGVRAHSNSEAGNVKYDYFFDAQDPTPCCWWRRGQNLRFSRRTARRRSSPGFRR